MNHRIVLTAICITSALALLSAGCGDDGVEADNQRIGAMCTVLDDCDDNNDDTEPLDCLTEFGGGYCGRAGCAASTDCPEGSVCVDYEGAFYCFRVCLDKADCNTNRDLANEANCSSNVNAVDTADKVCVPPSSGL